MNEESVNAAKQQERAIAILGKVAQAAIDAALSAVQQVGVSKTEGLHLCTVALIRGAAEFAKTGGVPYDDARQVFDGSFGRQFENLRRALGNQAIILLRAAMNDNEYEMDPGLMARAGATLAEWDELEGNVEKKIVQQASDVEAKVEPNLCGARDGMGASCTLPNHHKDEAGNPTKHIDETDGTTW